MTVTPNFEFAPEHVSRTGVPQVSVIMTHYRCERYLEEAVQSVLGQTHRDLELWVADDASSSGEWIERLSPYLSDPRLRLFQADRNVGTYRLKRLCIEHIRSPYIAFHDADDASEPGRIAEQVRMLENRRLDIVGTGYTITDDDGRPVGSKKMPMRCNWLFKLGRVFVIHHPTTLVRRKVFDEIGSFDGNTRIGADIEFALRASHKFRLGNSRRLLYKYRIRETSLTGDRTTGFGSDLRQAYSEALWERENARRDGSLRDFQPVPHDTFFTLTELPLQNS
jgi:glycosyltransferase involved in cell wall biosynthesis